MVARVRALEQRFAVMCKCLGPWAKASLAMEKKIEAVEQKVAGMEKIDTLSLMKDKEEVKVPVVAINKKRTNGRKN